MNLFFYWILTETPILWPPHVKSWLIGKDPDAVRDWGQEEKGMTENEMAGWHHWLDGRESEWTPGVGDGQGGLVCCVIHGVARSRTWLSDWTELNWTDIHGEGHGTPLQYSCLENTMDGGAWWAAVHGVAKSQTQLSDFTFTFHFHALEKEMTTHSSVLAWRIPEMGVTGALLSMGSHRIWHDWSNLAAAATDIQYYISVKYTT